VDEDVVVLVLVLECEVKLSDGILRRSLELNERLFFKYRELEEALLSGGREEDMVLVVLHGDDVVVVLLLDARDGDDDEEGQRRSASLELLLRAAFEVSGMVDDAEAHTLVQDSSNSSRSTTKTTIMWIRLQVSDDKMWGGCKYKEEE
jgi:hypothetical protein